MSETLLARNFTNAIGAQFSDTFRYQYAISEKALDLPEFRHTVIGVFNLYHCPLLPITQLESRDGTVLGYALGFPVTSDGQLLDGVARLDVSTRQPDIVQKLEAFVSDLSGRYIALLCLRYAGRTHACLYPDPTAALSVVYNPDTRICGSTLLLTLNRDIDPHPVYKVPATISAFPELAGLLPDSPVEGGLETVGLGQSIDVKARQLLANHALDLTDFSVHRTSLPEVSDGYLDPDDAAEMILERLGTTMAALQPTKFGYLAISGGLDSRMLMAAAPPGFGNQMTYYSYSDNWITGIDVHLANALAARIGERFVGQSAPETGSFFENADTSQTFGKRCAVSSGLKTAGDTWWSNGYFQHLTRGAMWLRGNSLEIVSARLWTPTVTAPLRKGLRLAMRRLGLDSGDPETYSILRQHMIDWHDTLPPDRRPTFHDFWFQELYLSHTQTGFLGMNEQIYFPPANDHAIFNISRSVEPGLRRMNALYDSIIKIGRPELSKIPTTGQIVGEMKQTGLDLDAVLSLHL